MRILLTGASGQHGAYLLDRLLEGCHEVIAWGGARPELRRGIALTPVDLADPDATARALDEADPDAILHAAALSSAEAVRLDPTRASRINVDATKRLADWSDRRDRGLVFPSTDLVFDGSKGWYREDDPASPILAYAATKLLAESAVLAASKGVVAKLSLVFGPSRCGRPCFFDQAIEATRKGEPRAFFEDEYRTPLDLATAAEALVGLLEGDHAGLFHVAGRERMSRFELIRRAATALGLDPSLVRPSRRGDANLPEPRPADVSLDATRLASTLPGLERPTVERALGAA